MKLIETKKLSKTYMGEGYPTPALVEADVTISKGEFVAIMGPSGSGKSTLLHILGFLDRQTSGEYFFKGEPSTNFHNSELARIRNQELGFVFQSFNLLPHMSVFDNVRLPLVYSSFPESEWTSRTEEAIKAVGLEQRRNFATLKLSGGEKQRVAIARALVNKPSVLFADEPTGNLDSKSGQSVMEILEDLNLAGHTIILITHETYTAEHAGRIIRLKDGRVESDSKVEVRRSAKKGFLK